MVYKLVAYLIDPNNKWQKSSITKEQYDEFVIDYQQIKLGNNAIDLLKKYVIESDVIREYENDNDEYIIEWDSDGVYLYERISQ